MDTLDITSISAHELNRYSDLLRDNSGLLFGSSSLLSSVSPNNLLAWKVNRGSDTVAIVAIAIERPGVGRVNLVVRPEARRQGIGTKSLAYVADDPAVKNLFQLCASVPAANMAAQKLLARSGFSNRGYNAEGLLEFEKRLPR